MGQGKAGWWIAGICAAVVLVSIGYGFGRKSALSVTNSSRTLEPAGAPLNASIQIEPIQPQEELASISVTQSLPNPQQTVGTAPQTAARLVSSPRPDSSPEGIRRVQQALKTAGYDPGPIDGQMGARTKTAIRDFQVAQGLEADGKVGPKTWSKLEEVINSSTTQTVQE
ncbi:MAG: peptidoglycan-binding protein [Candidatus Omnitrophica bacterium]|nr:peptidoglycan-binding protein [Candidatus Omnitrophota bacterium]